MKNTNTLAAEYIAAKIKAKRLEAGLGQAEVAARCNSAGYLTMTQQKVSEIEDCKRRMTLVEFWMFCRVFQISPDDILPPNPEYKHGYSFAPYLASSDEAVS